MIRVCHLSCPACGALSQQPQETAEPWGAVGENMAGLGVLRCLCLAWHRAGTESQKRPWGEDCDVLETADGPTLGVTGAGDRAKQTGVGDTQKVELPGVSGLAPRVRLLLRRAQRSRSLRGRLSGQV